MGKSAHRRRSRGASSVNGFLPFRAKRSARSAWGRAAPALDLQTVERDGLMSKLLTSMQRFLTDESGPTAVEYAVMLALIVVVCIAAITTLGNNANSTFSNVALNTAVGASS